MLQTLNDFSDHIEEKEPFVIRNVSSKWGAEPRSEDLMDLHFRSVFAYIKVVGGDKPQQAISSNPSG